MPSHLPAQHFRYVLGLIVPSKAYLTSHASPLLSITSLPQDRSTLILKRLSAMHGSLMPSTPSSAVRAAFSTFHSTSRLDLLPCLEFLLALSLKSIEIEPVDTD